MDKLSWCSAMKTGSGDTFVQDEHEEMHRFNHIVQIKLVSPFLFGISEYDKDVLAYIQRVHLLPEENPEEQHSCKPWVMVKLFVEVYRSLRGLIQDIPSDTLLSSESELRRCLTTGLSDIENNQKLAWFVEICDRICCGSKVQVPAIVIACLQFMAMDSPKEVVRSFEDVCRKYEQSSKEKHDLGDEQFKKELFKKALDSYTCALNQHPYSHDLYNKRARTHLQLCNFQEAEDDGFKAIFLKCDWSNGYCSVLEAVEKQGESELVSRLTEEAVSRCRTLSQSTDLNSLILLRNSLLANSEKDDTKDVRVNELTNGISDENGLNDTPQKQTQAMPELVTDTSDDNSEADRKSRSKTRKKRSRIKSGERKKCLKEKTQKIMEKNVCSVHLLFDCGKSLNFALQIDKWRELTRQASLCLVNQQYTSACTLYTDALNQLPPSVDDIEITLLKYACGISCIETKILEEMLKSVAIFEDIINDSNIYFPLAYYGLALCYYKQNRFKDALEAVNVAFSKIDQDFKTCTWPQTSVTIPESNRATLKTTLEDMYDKCRNPPRPEAICRHAYCGDCGHLKIEIYLNDPDCKGFVKILCNDGCCLNFHPNCWKNLKEERDQHNDKDYLNDQCLTPDCPSEIIELIYVDNKGEEIKKFNSCPMDKTLAGGTKQKRSKMPKKAPQKDKKKRKKSESEQNVKEDVSSNADENEQDNCVPKTEELRVLTVQLKKPNETKPCLIHPSLTPGANSGGFALLKRDGDDVFVESIRKAEKHKEKKKDKRKQVLTLDEFLGDNNTINAFAMSNEYIQRLIHLKEQKDNAERKKKNTGKSAKKTQSTPTNTNVPLWTENSAMLLADDAMFAVWQSDQPYRDQMMRESAMQSVIESVKDFITNSGPTHIHDSRFLNELSKLPLEIQEIIAISGGIETCLKDYDEFSVKNEILRFSDSVSSSLDENADAHEASDSEDEEHVTRNDVRDNWEDDDDDDDDEVDDNTTLVSAETSSLKGNYAESEVRFSPASMCNLKSAIECQLTNNEHVNSSLPKIEIPQSPIELPQMSPHCTKLQKLWKFVPKFSESGHRPLLRLLLKTIINEKVLERYGTPGDNIDKTIVSFKFAVDALSDSVDCTTQTDFVELEMKNHRKELAETKGKNVKLATTVKEHEELIQYLLSNEKQQMWLEELRTKDEEIRDLKRALQEAEAVKNRLLDEITIKDKPVNPTSARLTRSASITRPQISNAQEFNWPSKPPDELPSPSITNWAINSIEDLFAGQAIAPPCHRITANNKHQGVTNTTQVEKSGTSLTKNNVDMPIMPLMSIKTSFTNSTTQVEGVAPSKNCFEKLMLALESKFPRTSRAVLEEYVQQLRNHRSKNTLTGLTMEQIVQRVSKMIEAGLENTGKLNSALGAKSMGLDRISQPGAVWLPISRDRRQREVENCEEEPCAICHEDFETGIVIKLQCSHSFHQNCIKKWFKQECTCPTCRAHCLLPDEFPSLNTNSTNRKHAK